MKTIILPLLLLFSVGLIKAQQRDLNYFLEQARINSPLIQKNKESNKILELDLKQIELILKNPIVSLESNVLFAPIISHDNNNSRLQLISAGANNYTGYDLANTDGGQFQAFVSLKQPLFKSSSLQSYSYKADISRQQNENSTSQTIHEIEQLAGYQYILCLKSKQEIDNSLSLLKQLNKQLIILKKLVESSIYKQTDLMLLQIEYQNLELDTKTFQDEFKNNLYDLNLICGINEPIVMDIAALDLQLKSDNVTNSQFLTSFRLDSLNIVAGQSINELKYKPQLSLFANAGLNATYLPAFKRLGFSTGLTFSWTIYDGNQRKIEREKSFINLQTLGFKKNHLITQKQINKNKISHQINALNEKTITIEKQLIQYDKLYDVYQKELSQGIVSVMDFKNILKDIAAKKQENVMLQMEKQVLINSYNYWNYWNY